MERTKKQMLIECFENAIKEGIEFLGVSVAIDNAEQPEFIINHISNYKAKMDYYNDMYDVNLVHKHAENVRILNFGSCDDAGLIVEALMR